MVAIPPRIKIAKDGSILPLLAVKGKKAFYHKPLKPGEAIEKTEAKQRKREAKFKMVRIMEVM